MDIPSISVVIPIYNGEKTLVSCLTSILTQTIEANEIICVDNNSSDCTKDIIFKFAHDNQKIKYVFEKLKSRGAARNAGIGAAKGNIIAGLDADCIAKDDWLENITRPIIDDDETIVMGSESDPVGNFWTREIQKDNESFAFANLDPSGKHVNFFDSKDFAAKAELLRKIEFNPEIENCEDYEFKLRLDGLARIRFEPAAIVAHLHRDNIGSVVKTFFGRGWWIAKIVSHNKKLIKAQDKVAESVSLSNMLLFVPWVMLRLVINGPKRWFYLVITQASWRAGIITYWLLGDNLPGRPWWEQLLFKIKIGDFEWGRLRFTIYNRLNRCYKTFQLPPSVLEFVALKTAQVPVKKISVVIATYNRLDALKKYVLDGLRRQRISEAEFEIIIIDNNSSDGTWQYLKTIESPRLIIAQEMTRGASAARNKGIELASGQIIAFLDDDCLPDENWLSRMYGYFSQSDYSFGQGAIFDHAYETVLNYLSSDDPGDKFYSQFYEGNLSFRSAVFNFVSFNRQMIYGKEGYDLISQIEYFLPGFKYFFDPLPIDHYRSPAYYRKSNSSELTEKEQKNERKFYWLWQINMAIRRRNTKILSPYFTASYLLKEILFFAAEIFFLPSDLGMLVKTKIIIFQQLASLRRQFLAFSSDNPRPFRIT